MKNPKNPLKKMVAKVKTIEPKKVTSIDVKKERVESLRKKDIAMGMSGKNTESYKRKAAMKLPYPDRVSKEVKAEVKSRPSLKTRMVEKMLPKVKKKWESKDYRNK